MGKADFFADGQWNFFCDLCGAKQKSGRAMKTWNGLYVCRHHKEVRNPQDFIRGVKDDPSVPWTRPEKVPETFVPAPLCTLRSRNSLPAYGVPGCLTPGLVNLSFLPSDPNPGYPQCTLEGLNSIPGFASPGCSIPRYDHQSIPVTPPLDTYEGIY